MSFSQFWFLRDDTDTAYRFDNILLRDRRMGVQNSTELGDAEEMLGEALNDLTSADIPLPGDFPPPRLALPKKGFAPDYFSFGPYKFCSVRLREALALPQGVVQYAPVDLVSGGAAPHAQEYCTLRVLAIQPAMDLERSDCEVETHVNIRTGKHFKWPTEIERFVLLDGLQPLTDIFRMAELPCDILVTDALAERVLRAGCTGIEFSDPANSQSGHRIVRYRTANGVAEREV